MDAQGRGSAGDIDPADQWVFNPDTGSYELRLDASDGSGGRGPSPERDSGTAQLRQVSRREDAPEGRVPSQRRPEQNDNAPRAAASRRRAKPRANRKQKALRWTGATLALLVVGGSISAYLLYEHFNGNIDKVDVGIHNEAKGDEPLNILVIGTDARSGKGNTGYGDAGSVGHADTTLLFHVSKDRTNATALSIPRDMITDIPSCPTKQKDGSEKVIPGTTKTRFNTSLGQSGRDPGCTWRTVEKMTGVKINHFMMADFNAVKELSSAVGGVEVCAAKDINDPKSHLRLKAGRHTVKGEQALAFVRTRHTIGTGSDLSRIELQQQFIGSMIRKMKSSGTVSNPSKLFKMANVMTDNLTVDTGIGSVKKLTDLAKDLRQVDTKNITFATVPVLDNPEDPATVILNESKAKSLFKMVRSDKSLSKTGGKKKPEDNLKNVDAAPAEQVRVDVTNGGGPIGAAQETVDWLQNNKSVRLSTNAGNAPQKLTKTRLTYATNQAGQAKTLAKMMGLSSSALKKSSEKADAREPMQLILGKDFEAAGEPVSPPEKAPDGVQNVNAKKKVCAK
ncbi:LCP family protein [Streptomyces sp. NPDC005438]|uniref:LCP family protein n=1 Tax=Streptomyces sp. NPDC005438 TaxID=3156880 RepID=UPI0033B0A8CE